jgi:hypothetical protein
MPAVPTPRQMMFGYEPSARYVFITSMGSHRTSVLTELAMKHCSCASWCMDSCSVAVGRLPPENTTRGCNVTSVIANLRGRRAFDVSRSQL